MSCKPQSILLTEQEAVLLYLHLSHHLTLIRPPEERKGAKNLRQNIRTFEAIVEKLSDAFPTIHLAAHPPRFLTATEDEPSHP